MRAFRGKTRRAPDADGLQRQMRELFPDYRPELTAAELAALRRAAKMPPEEQG